MRLSPYKRSRFGTSKPNPITYQTGSKQTLWDWLQLLIIPAVLAGVGLWFNRQQREQELQTADRRAQDEALQAYLDQMSGMLIPKTDQPSLYKARQGDSLSSVARARTLTVLTRLDGYRKARVVQFLHESGLIAKKHPIVAMRGTDLSGADLFEADLRGTDLTGAKLSGAAPLIGADLSGTDLNDATGWTEEQFADAKSLEGATMPNGQKYEEWLKSRGKGDSATPEQRGPWWGGPYHRGIWRRLFGGS